MSDIKIQPSATGSATVTLTAPATSTARTVTLPDGTGTLLNSDGSGANLTNLPNGSQLDHSGTKKIEATALGVSVTGASYSTGNIGVNADNHLGFSDDSWARLVVNDTEICRVLSTGGITFNGDTAAANALDDYEEGTWTPTLSGTSGGPSGVNFTYRLGWYTKIGRVVIADCRIAMSSWSSGPSGSALISGLPFNAPASSNYFASPTIGYTHNFDSDNAPKGGFVEEGSSVIRLIRANDTSARQVFSQNVSASALNGNETIFISVAYIVSA